MVDGDGTVVAAAGDPSAVTTLRSCVKPVQALPLMRAAEDGFEISDAEVAIACASHGGEPVHVEVVRRLLERAGLDEEALACGPQLPMDETTATAVLVAGAAAAKITNNCSGKHAGMLAVCAVRGWPTAGYADFDHPLQVEIRDIMGGLAGIDLDLAPVGIDGCGLPTYGLELRGLARMLAAACTDTGFRRCQDAMAEHPYLVAGRERFDTAMLQVAGRRLTVKGGAAGVWVAVHRPGGPALAIKLEAGDQTAITAVALAAVEALGWLDAAQLAAPALAGFARPAVHNWAGEEVGKIAVEPGWVQRLAG